MHFIPVLKSLQGHPEAGALWEKMISKILGTLGLKSTTQERNLYHGKIDGHFVLICHMVDNYTITCHDHNVDDKIIAHINKAATTASLGVGSCFNGIDIVQPCNYI